jgi:hypothetical protein
MNNVLELQSDCFTLAKLLQTFYVLILQPRAQTSFVGIWIEAVA